MFMKFHEDQQQQQQQSNDDHAAGDDKFLRPNPWTPLLSRCEGLDPDPPPHLLVVYTFVEDWMVQKFIRKFRNMALKYVMIVIQKYIVVYCDIT